MLVVNWLMVTILSVLTAAVLAVVIWLIVRTYRQKTTTGKEDLKGRTAIVRTALTPRGVVFVEGELWNAISTSGKIEVGEEVIVSELIGLTLIVNIKGKE
ncbi:MAG TPA: NfeD family protein [Dehalococcoidales bacterium]|nr:NfeD family protein [Dehalococcoidales bacterium]